MEVGDIDSHAVLKELTELLSGEFLRVVQTLGYRQKDALFATEQALSEVSELQLAIAKALRRNKNRKILGVTFDSPTFKASLERLSSLLSGWHEYFVETYLDMFDWELSLHHVEGILERSFKENPSVTTTWVGFELFHLTPPNQYRFNDVWELRPLMPEFLAGSSEDLHWIQGSIQTKWIPSEYELDQANGFLFCKSMTLPNNTSIFTDIGNQYALMQLQPVVARSNRIYSIHENPSTGESRVFEIPMQVPHLRIRLPLGKAHDLSTFIEDTTWLLDHAKYMHSHPKIHSALQRYILALNFFSSGTGEAAAYDDAVHDAVIGLETLLIGSQTEVNYRFQSVISRLLPEESLVIRDGLKRLYQLRSDVAHQGRTTKPKTTHVDAFQAISLLNGAIRWYLTKAENMSEKEIQQYLDSLPFGTVKDCIDSPWGSMSEIVLYPPQETGPWKV